MRKELLNLFYDGKYDDLVIEIKKELRNSDDSDLLYYLFLSENRDYSNMNMNNIINEVNFNKALEDADQNNKIKYQVEYNFFRNIGSSMAKYFCYALRDNIDKFIRTYNEIGIPRLYYDDKAIEIIIKGLEYFSRINYSKRSIDLLLLSTVILSVGTNNSKICKMCNVYEELSQRMNTILSPYSLVLEESYVRKLVNLYDNYEKNLVFDQGDFKFLTNQNKTRVCLIKFTNFNATDVIVPRTYQGMPVVAIGEEAFSKCKKLRSINIGENIEYIDEYAFWECEGLFNIMLSKKLKLIKKSAFTGCNAIKSFYIPDSVVEIGESVFTGCNRLEKLYIGKGLSVIPSYAFSNRRLLNEVILNEGLEIIESKAFQNCTSLEWLTLPNSLEEIGKGAFDGCKKLKLLYKGSEYEWNQIKGVKLLELEIYFDDNEEIELEEIID